MVEQGHFQELTSLLTLINRLVNYGNLIFSPSNNRPSLYFPYTVELV